MQGTLQIISNFDGVTCKKKNLHSDGDDQWISLHVQVHTPRDKCLIDDTASDPWLSWYPVVD